MEPSANRPREELAARGVRIALISATAGIVLGLMLPLLLILPKCLRGHEDCEHPLLGIGFVYGALFGLIVCTPIIWPLIMLGIQLEALYGGYRLRAWGATLVGTLLGLINVAVLSNALPVSFRLLAATALGGLIAGAVEGAALRPAARLGLNWLLLQALAWLTLARFLQQIAPWLTAYYATAGIWLCGMVIGLALAAAQWHVLRRQLHPVDWWIPVKSSSWALNWTLLWLGIGWWL